ncbi:MAG: signal peptide peptidase SppA [Rhizobiales bacterium]|nr:signal peptide peptidase SppA [Hyphomicrobiales bacterium]
MTPSADQILDRRRMRRKLTIWRVVAFLSIALALAAFFGAAAFSSGLSFDKSQPHIARVPISGFIASSDYALEQLDKIRDDDHVKAVIIAIDSPGGTTVGGEALYNAFRKIATEKPVVTSVGSLAASAGYMVAVAADHIVAPRTSIVGSVGVIMQYPNASKLLGTLGVTVEEIKSSPIKAEPSPFNETPPAARIMLESMILDTYTWFADLVKERRKFKDGEATGVLDGSVFTGKQALERSLIDAIGDETVAKQWLVEEKNVQGNLEVVTWSLTRTDQDFVLARALIKSLLTTIGLGSIFDVSQDVLALSKGANLDGFLSIWQVNGITGD